MNTPTTPIAKLIHTSVHCSFIARETCTGGLPVAAGPELELVAPLLALDAAVIRGCVVDDDDDGFRLKELTVVVAVTVSVPLPLPTPVGRREADGGSKSELAMQLAMSSPFAQHMPATGAQTSSASQ